MPNPVREALGMRAGDAIRNAHAKDTMRVLTTWSAHVLAAKLASGASTHMNVAANNEPRSEHSVRRKSLADTKQKSGNFLKTLLVHQLVIKFYLLILERLRRGPQPDHNRLPGRWVLLHPY